MLQSYESCFVLENVLCTRKDVDLGEDGTARTIAALSELGGEIENHSAYFDPGGVISFCLSIEILYKPPSTPRA